MMNIIMVCGLCITASVLCKIVEKNTKEISVAISLIAVVVILIFVIGKISDINTTLTQLFEKAGISDEYISILFKSAGICYITQLGADVCKDCGESSLSNVVELAGKISILSITIPIINAIVTIVEGILV